ncbi:MAG: GMC family oxidoreductase, partial [Myxococcales bacterium]|nr:GMC family oxidoreductase [Myxococcales bacterium]
GGYAVFFRDHEKQLDGQVEADAVFVCAGAVNTTELLLRCRDEHATLPGLSPALGHHYSGNGDYLAFAFETSKKFEPSVGPTITTGIVYDRGSDDQRAWFIFEEGGYPKEIACLLQVLDPKKQFGQDVSVLAIPDLKRVGEALARERIGRNTDVGANSAVFLAMGRDLANGRIDLVPGVNLLKITWDVPSNMPLYGAEERFSNDIAHALGGAMGYNPFWKLLHRPVSVHNLGGCVMAEHPSDGVVDPGGEAFGYPNLFVLDGAALPASTGTNPSHTIAAVAERNVERFIRRQRSDPAWCAPESAKAVRIQDPLDALTIPKGGTAAPITGSIGLSFTETMKGFVAAASSEPNSIEEYERLANQGEQQNRAAQFTLTITVLDVDTFIADRSHAAIAIGDVRVVGLTERDGSPVTSGVFNLFEGTGSLNARRMLYALPFYGADAQPYLLTGFKDVRDHGAFDVWAATSTLYTVIRSGHDAQGPVVAAGVIHILKKDFAHQMTTLRAIGPGSPLAHAEALARFGRLFMGTLFDVFVRPRLDF